jgi:hypothetical protein
MPFLPFFPQIYNQLKWRKSKQKRVGSRRQKTKKVQDALYDAAATDDNVESPCPLDKEPAPDQPKALPFTQEIAPDRLDAITYMDIENKDTSTDVNAIVSYMRRMSDDNDVVHVVAPTGLAAFNVLGGTLHRFAGLDWRNMKKGMTNSTME